MATVVQLPYRESNVGQGLGQLLGLIVASRLSGDRKAEEAKARAEAFRTTGNVLTRMFGLGREPGTRTVGGGAPVPGGTPDVGQQIVEGLTPSVASEAMSSNQAISVLLKLADQKKDAQTKAQEAAAMRQAIARLQAEFPESEGVRAIGALAEESPELAKSLGPTVASAVKEPAKKKIAQTITLPDGREIKMQFDEDLTIQEMQDFLSAQAPGARLGELPSVPEGPRPTEREKDIKAVLATEDLPDTPENRNVIRRFLADEAQIYREINMQMTAETEEDPLRFSTSDPYGNAVIKRAQQEAYNIAVREGKVKGGIPEVTQEAVRRAKGQIFKFRDQAIDLSQEIKSGLIARKVDIVQEIQRRFPDATTDELKEFSIESGLMTDQEFDSVVAPMILPPEVK